MWGAMVSLAPESCVTEGRGSNWPAQPISTGTHRREKNACKGGYDLGSYVCYKFLVPLFSNLGHNTANPFKVIKDEFGKNKVIIFISDEP